MNVMYARSNVRAIRSAVENKFKSQQSRMDYYAKLHEIVICWDILSFRDKFGRDEILYVAWRHFPLDLQIAKRENGITVERYTIACQFQ